MSGVVKDRKWLRVVKWTLKNEGSKKSYIRFKIIDKPFTAGETAWAEGERFVDPGNWAMYFEIGNGWVKEVRLLAGQNAEIGKVTVWDSDGNLHVKYSTENGWSMKTSHLAVVDDLILIPTNASGNPVPGRFPFKTLLDGVTSYEWIIPLTGTYPEGALKGLDYSWELGAPLYIAAHADVNINAMAQWTISEQCAGWDKWVKGSDGYWYYADIVHPSQEIEVCFKVCFPANIKNGNVEFELEIEAVQASNCAIDYQWPTHPWYPLCP